MSAILSQADEEELRIAYDLFRSDRPLTEEEEMVLYDPTKDQIPTLAQVRKRQEKYRYRSPFSKPPKVLTDIPLTPPELHEQSLSALNRVDELHAKAKEMADLAFVAGMENQMDKIKLLYKQAFDYERKAAILSAQTGDVEFTPADLFESAADLALDAEAYQEAEQMIKLGFSAEPLIEVTEKLLGLLDYLADIYYENGEYKKAQPLFEKALAIREERLEDDHWTIPHAMNNLGLVSQALGEYNKAQPLFEKALAIREKTLDVAHPDVATSLNNLGMLYQKQGEYDKAQPLLEKALAIREKILGAEHPTMATSLNQLGQFYQEKAKHLFEKALAIVQSSQRHYDKPKFVGASTQPII
jgi:tetratricopeptide (TPR) repeat protein